MHIQLSIKKYASLITEKLMLILVFILFSKKTRKIGVIDLKQGQTSKIPLPKKHRNLKYSDFCFFVTTLDDPATFDFVIENKKPSDKFCRIKSPTAEDTAFQVKAWVGNSSFWLKPVIMQARRAGFIVPSNYSITQVTHIDICSSVDFVFTVHLEASCK